jgi:3-hydroxyisobutyrate dehydrogenase
MTKIGFIGLGNMGLPMAKNLLKAGHEVTAFDLSADAMAEAKEHGASLVTSVIDAAKAVEVVVSMVPAGAHVKGIYLGEEGVIAHADAGTLFIDCSTIDVNSAREVNAAATEAGFDMVDAPVSGGVGGAEAGTLTFMVGGSDKAFERSGPILEVLGGKIIHAGGAGNGEAAKIANNMLLAISMIGVSEAFVLARKLGVEDQVLFDISSTSSGQCWSLNTYCPVPGPVETSPANRDYAPGFTAAMMLKDLRLARDAAEGTDANTPLGALSESLYSKMQEEGHGAVDFSGVFKMLNGDF